VKEIAIADRRDLRLECGEQNVEISNIRFQISNLKSEI